MYMYMCTYCHQNSPYSTVITQVSFPHYSSSTVVIGVLTCINSTPQTVARQ